MPTQDQKEAESSEHPSWADVARLRRKIRKLEGELEVANEELNATETIVEEVESIRVELVEHAKKEAVANREKNEALRELKHVREVRTTLEGQLGEVEARLARALGRTLIIEKEGEIAEIGSAMWNALQLCLVDAPYGEAPTGDNLLGSGRYGDNGPGMVRLRQVRDVLNRTCKSLGIRDVVARKKGGE